MASITLFQDADHRNILLEDFGRGQAVQANQHLIVHDGAGMILDPGGHKVYTRAMSESATLLGDGELKLIFFSHQDPDIIAAANGWLMTTEATAWISALWVRFVPHFGLDQLVMDRLKAIPDEGMRLSLGGSELLVLPAHFLHSPGNFQVYDPVSKILYTGDLGASLGQDFTVVADFDAHLRYMEGFHKRYMASNRAMRVWATRARRLDVETIAPQHGAMVVGRPMVERFIAWAEGLACGTDLLEEGV